MHRFSATGIPHQNLLSPMDLQNPQFTLGFTLPTGSNSAQNTYTRRKTWIAWLLGPKLMNFNATKSDNSQRLKI